MIDQNNLNQNKLDEFETPDRPKATTDLEEENDFLVDPSGSAGHKWGRTRGLVRQPIGGDAFGGQMTRKPSSNAPKKDDNVTDSNL